MVGGANRLAYFIDYQRRPRTVADEAATLVRTRLIVATRCLFFQGLYIGLCSNVDR